MSALPQIEALEQRRERLLADLAAIDDLRPGTLSKRYRKCGKPNCHCATDPDGGHGPSFSLTRQCQGKTVTRVIPRQAVDQTRAQLAECQRFRNLCAKLIDVSEQLCDARLRHKKASSKTAQAEKGGSRACSKRRSRRKSTA